MSNYTSVAALVISLASFAFAIMSWRESNRPIVTVRITTEKGKGEGGSPVEIIVENSGNRPAKNIRLVVDRGELDQALIQNKEHKMRKKIERCFDDETVIPVLEPGKKTSNYFGYFGLDEHATWKYKSTIHVYVYYQNLKGRRFSDSIPIWLVDAKGFALGWWDEPKKL
ncbi:MAG: hypothetical protein OQL28_09785 [Sedimenticola sp.]|nr:hypothetical protein [Sedimenticola sp.]